MSKKKLWLIIPLLLVIGYLMGPKPSTPVYKKDMPVVPEQSAKLEEYILEKESVHKIKEGTKRGLFGSTIRPVVKPNMPLFTCMDLPLRNKKQIRYIVISRKNLAVIFTWPDWRNMVWIPLMP